MADPNPKFMAVVACTKDLENGIAANSPADIGAKLMNKLLDFEDYSKLRLPSTPEEKAQIIVGAISTKVRAEPDIKFDQLKKFVKEHGGLGYLHKILEDSLSGHSIASGNQQPASATSVSTSTTSLSNPATPAQATAPLQAAAQPTEGDSQLLKNNWKVMITTMTFDTSWLAGEMNRTGLLSDNDHQDVTKVKNMLNDTEKAEIMLTSLKKKVELNSKHLSTFLDILILKSSLYSDTINILQGGHSTASGNQQPTSATSLSTSATSLSNPATPAQDLIWKVQIRDTKYLKCITYHDPNTSEKRELRILDDLSADWEDIGEILGFRPPEINAIRHPGAGKTPIQCLREVISKWMKDADNMPYSKRYPCNWTGLHNLLMDSKHGTTANDLKAAITASRSDLRGNFDEE